MPHYTILFLVISVLVSGFLCTLPLDISKEVEQLREALLLGSARVEAELETKRWSEQGRKLQKFRPWRSPS